MRCLSFWSSVGGERYPVCVAHYTLYDTWALFSPTTLQIYLSFERGLFFTRSTLPSAVDIFFFIKVLFAASLCLK